MGTTNVTKTDRALIVTLREKDFTLYEIAFFTGWSLSTVKRVLRAGRLVKEQEASLNVE
jgi:DNA-directed RNA polymerase specialized sigma24 family protein